MRILTVGGVSSARPVQLTFSARPEVAGEATFKYGELDPGRLSPAGRPRPRCSPAPPPAAMACCCQPTHGMGGGRGACVAATPADAPSASPSAMGRLISR